MLNPDGYTYSRNKYRRWRKTTSKQKTSNRTRGKKSRKTECRGVDLNRNFGYKWRGKGSSNNPCSAIYAGKKPLSESESLSLAKYLYKKRRKLAAFLDVHTYGQMWMSPWGFSKRYPEHYDRQMAASKDIQAAISKENGESYLIGRTSSLLYRTSGTAIDWVYGSLGIVYTYGVELRPDSETKKNHFKRGPEDIEPSGRDLLVGVKALGVHMVKNHVNG